MARRGWQTVATPMMKTADQTVMITLSLLNDTLGSAPLQNVAVRLWDGTIWKPDPGSSDPIRCTLVLKHPGALRRMFLPPSGRKLGEAYIYDDFDIEGEIEVIVAPMIEYLFERKWGIMERLRFGKRLLSLPKIGQPRSGNVAAKLRGRLHSKERDREAISYHYDRRNDFFARWLDSRMIYTCAYFATPDDDLETAQEAKLDYLCRKLRLQPGERLLDIGCGWGGLIIYAAQHYGVEAVGVTNSAHQAELARERISKAGLAARCRVDVRDYREVEKLQGYDKLVSVGMPEHVGAALLPTFFKCAWDALRPQGVFLNHAIGAHSAEHLPAADFVRGYSFPDAEPVPIDTVLRAAEAVGFGVRDVENLKEHYAYTMRHWLHRIEEQADDLKRIAGDPTYRSFRLVFAVAMHGFAAGPANLYQTLLVKPEKGRSGLPLRRQDWYKSANCAMIRPDA
jgi:cyclopropane-fatty-acyl-phospholipid synthase